MSIGERYEHEYKKTHTHTHTTYIVVQGCTEYTDETNRTMREKRNISAYLHPKLISSLVPTAIFLSSYVMMFHHGSHSFPLP
jgi:hypothetical protein